MYKEYWNNISNSSNTSASDSVILLPSLPPALVNNRIVHQHTKLPTISLLLSSSFLLPYSEHAKYLVIVEVPESQVDEAFKHIRMCDITCFTYRDDVPESNKYILALQERVASSNPRVFVRIKKKKEGGGEGERKCLILWRSIAHSRIYEVLSL